MMADFHDGIGGYLVNAINHLRSNRTNTPDASEDDRVLLTTLNHALEDLRFIISNITHENVDIGVMLGTFRERIEPFLQEQSIELIWDVGTFPSDVALDSSGRLNILRILQEASTNVIKHANATSVTIRTTADSIEIEDNVPACPRRFNTV